jgi:hypothetical protein
MVTSFARRSIHGGAPAVNSALARGRALGLRIGGGSPEVLKQTIDKVTDIYARVIKSAHIKPE